MAPPPFVSTKWRILIKKKSKYKVEDEVCGFKERERCCIYYYKLRSIKLHVLPVKKKKMLYS
jgi:hypothetical protein